MNNEELIKTVDFKKGVGLVPTIIQDFNSKEVLMMAYMNEESLKKTLQDGTTWFWSRSRNEFWNKGATSGNVQIVKNISVDCDGDTLLVEVVPKGPACHTGNITCFYRKINFEENSNE
jgi:phosphoribosyl-AMP cyclohydrolase